MAEGRQMSRASGGEITKTIQLRILLAILKQTFKFLCVIIVEIEAFTARDGAGMDGKLVGELKRSSFINGAGPDINSSFVDHIL
ncbi:hypothetical protein EVAR_75421_1 [Eumeta japonica]|uniref:Uncharacterized protein n=1 Tax=Eumeta variegata TaxID=151549 RepID=A0A4C1TJU8_EUMVA|nr:hypothetical protein EVAR_75421_1 [Eumeta japonica]